MNNPKNSGCINLLIGVGYVIAIGLFCFGLLAYDAPYYQAIDPIDRDYSPFSNHHALSLFIYGVAFQIALWLVWTRSRKLPPLMLTLCMVFILIGILLSFVVLFQISEHRLIIADYYTIGGSSITVGWLFVPFLLLMITMGCIALHRTITAEINEAKTRHYQNKFLERINSFLANKTQNIGWLLLFMFPVLFVMTLVLILFGQAPDSLVKVFTDTTTWVMSQKDHPPVLDHTGHYLCTVAAKGDPKIVKPLRLGRRHGNTIIVNRQLMVANALEELLQDSAPLLHRVIRSNYDRYGYNLSLKINTAFRSNATYLLMKPLEWLFILCLYLCCVNPEQKISNQYQLKKT